MEISKRTLKVLAIMLLASTIISSAIAVTYMRFTFRFTGQVLDFGAVAIFEDLGCTIPIANETLFDFGDFVHSEYEQCQYKWMFLKNTDSHASIDVFYRILGEDWIWNAGTLEYEQFNTESEVIWYVRLIVGLTLWDTYTSFPIALGDVQKVIIEFGHTLKTSPSQTLDFQIGFYATDGTI